MSKHLAEFQEHLLKSRRIVALVGAGLSASSGLPVFRGAEGLWKNFNVIDLATPDAFYIDAGLVWQFYSWRRYCALRAKPNGGHRALAALLRLAGVDYITITQNVDGLHVRSGHNRQNLFEVHGLLFSLKCTSFSCNYEEHENYRQPLTPALRATEFEYESSTVSAGAGASDAGASGDRGGTSKGVDTPAGSDCAAGAAQAAASSAISSLGGASPSPSPQFAPVLQLNDADLPQCPVCKDGSLLRPGVVWFGESLPLGAMHEIDDFLERDHVDLILVIGTSGTVYPANSYVDRVRLQGGKVAVFNTDIEQHILDGCEEGTWGFEGDAAKWLPIALEPLLSTEN